MARATSPAVSSTQELSGAYVLIQTYDHIAIPVEHLSALASMMLLDHHYEGGNTTYSVKANSRPSLVILSKEEMTAIRVAHKLAQP